MPFPLVGNQTWLCVVRSLVFCVFDTEKCVDRQYSQVWAGHPFLVSVGNFRPTSPSVGVLMSFACLETIFIRKHEDTDKICRLSKLPPSMALMADQLNFTCAKESSATSRVVIVVCFTTVNRTSELSDTRSYSTNKLFPCLFIV